MHEIVRQVHHLAEAIVHDRQTAVGGEHAQTVRHVVERGVELTGQRRLALGRHQSLNEDPVQIGRYLLQREKEHGANHRKPHIVGRAMERQRDRGRTAGERDLHMEDPRPAIGAACACRHVSGGDGQADHVSHGVVAVEECDRTPCPERNGIEHRPDLVADLPARRFLGGQSRSTRLVPAHIERTGRAGDDQKRDTRPEQTYFGLDRRHDRRNGHQQRACEQRRRILKK